MKPLCYHPIYIISLNNKISRNVNHECNTLHLILIYAFCMSGLPKEKSNWVKAPMPWCGIEDSYKKTQEA